MHSIPRNPILIKLFRYAKLGENAGYGINKILAWERLSKGKVEFSSDLISSTITYWLGEQVSGQVGEQVSEQVQLLINCMRDMVLTIGELQKRIRIKSRRYVREEMVVPAIEGGFLACLS